MSIVIRRWQRLREGWIQRRRFTATLSRLAELDRRALRDLGLDASEIASVSAEASGLARADRLQGYLRNF